MTSTGVTIRQVQDSFFIEVSEGVGVVLGAVVGVVAGVVAGDVAGVVSKY